MKISELLEAKDSQRWKILLHPGDGAGPAYPKDQVDKLLAQLNKKGAATLVRSTAKNLEITVKFDKQVSEDEVWDCIGNAKVDAELGWGGSVRPMKKINEIKDDPDAEFSFREVYGVTIHKATMRSDWFNPRGPGKKDANLPGLTKEQRSAFKKLEDDEYDMINGWYANGKEWPRETDNRDGVWFEKSIPVFAKAGTKGAVAILPSGKVKNVSSKTWKPDLSDFKL